MPRVECDTEKIARRMAREAGQPEALWELFLLDAYKEYYQLGGNNADDTRRTSER